MRTFHVKGIHIGRKRPVLMGILNISPESFYTGSFVPISAVQETAEIMITSGAEILDIGARSTAPNCHPLSVAEEITRVKKCLAQLDGGDYAISIDTMHPEVLRAALRYDISLVNDISGLVNPEMGSLIADAELPAVLMATRENPGDARSFQETQNAIHAVLVRASKHGVKDIILDPGLGKWTAERTAEDDWDLCRRFGELKQYELPLLVAVSRKSFIGEVTGQPPMGRLAGTLAVTTRLIEEGAAVIRAHDISETRDLITSVTHMKGIA